MNVLKPLEKTCRIENNREVCPERVPPYLEEHGNVTTTEKIMGELISTVYTHIHLSCHLYSAISSAIYSGNLS